jgi:outer membrane protein
MKGLYITVLCFMGIILFQGHILAAADVKFAVVDIQKFQENSVAFQKIRADIKARFDALQKKLDQERDALMKLDEELKKQSMMLSLDAQEDKKRELEKKRRYYKYLQEDFTQEIKALEVDAIKKTMKELETVVKDIAKKDGYTLILEKRTLGLMYYDPSVDITEKVIKGYDKTKQ